MCVHVCIINFSMHLISVDIEIETDAYYGLEQSYIYKYTFLIILHCSKQSIKNWQPRDVDHNHKEAMKL